MPKISALTAASALAGTETLPVVQGGATVAATVDQVATRVIASDAEIAAIAGLTSAADRGLYFTGSGTASLFTFTAFARTIMDDADAAAVRTTLALVPGTNVQTYDAQLADIAGITFAQGDVLYFNGTNLVALGAGTNGHFLKTQGAGANPTWAAASATITTAMGITIDGGGSAITTGVKGDLYIPVACTITANTLIADQSGSIVIDIWKDTYANYPPTVADTITASAKPTLSSAIKSQDTTLTGWTTSCAAGDTLRFNVDSAATVTRVHLSLKITIP